MAAKTKFKAEFLIETRSNRLTEEVQYCWKDGKNS